MKNTSNKAKSRSSSKTKTNQSHHLMSKRPKNNASSQDTTQAEE